ncbi:MAG TPA: hypothetical protein PKC22_00310 [Rhodocyclaceae bacterium]|nr:hypothetical protein [Rhodocyclaceae bacterium]
MLNCRDASRMLIARPECPLHRRERLALRLHLFMCGACRRFARQLTWTHKGLRWLAHDADDMGDVHLSPEARDRIRSVLAERRDHANQGPDPDRRP